MDNPARSSKRLRGVLAEETGTQGSSQVVVPLDGAGGHSGSSGERAREIEGTTQSPTGCRLTWEEVDGVEGVVERLKREAEKVERGLPENVSVTGHELDAATRAAVRFVLMQGTGGGLLMAKDLNAEIANVIVPKKGLTAVVIAKTQYILAKSFGVELIELEKQNKSGGKYYILRSLVPARIYAECIAAREGVDALGRRGMLGYLVTLVYMSCGSLPEPELYRHMEAVGVGRAKVGEVVDDAVRGRYIMVDRSAGMDEGVKVYAVAERALVEGMTEEAVLGAVAAEFAEDDE